MSGNPVTIKGLTWDHPRAYEGLEAETRRFNEANPGIRVQWDRQSLREFEASSVADNAARYDLVILDHPFMGDAVSTHCLVDMNTVPEFADIRANPEFIGKSFESYDYGGGRWAIPIDAACQTAAFRPDLLDAIPHTLDEVLAHAERNKIGLAMACPHAFMNFLTLCGLMGADISGTRERLVERSIAVEAVRILRELASHIPRQAFDWSSIALLEAMATEDLVAYAPMVFCFNSYSRQPGPDRHRLGFASLPTVVAERGCTGSVIGGAGLAISATRPLKQEVLQFVHHIASPSTQIAMALDGGQPASQGAWTNREVDAINGGFFSGCLETMRGAIVRPRYPGYMKLQNGAGDLLRHDAMERQSAIGDVVDEIETLFAKTLRSST